MSAFGVRREKVAPFQWVQVPPGHGSSQEVERQQMVSKLGDLIERNHEAFIKLLSAAPAAGGALSGPQAEERFRELRRRSSTQAG